MQKAVKIVQLNSYPVMFASEPELIVRDKELTELPTGDIDSLHYHNLCEVGICRCGTGLWVVGDSVTAIKPGDTMIIPPGVHHYSRSVSRICRCEFIYFDGENLLSGCGISLGRRLGQVAESVIRDRELSGFLRSMIEAREIVESALWYSLFLTKLPRLSEETSAAPEERTDRLSPAIRRIILSYAEPLTVEQLAGECGFCPSWFQKQFRHEYGTTPIAMLNDFRVRVAAQLLRGGLSVTEACVQSGFNSPSDLYRHFMKKYGISPSEYRRTTE